VTAPVDRLLAAADLLDKRAGEATEGPWYVDDVGTIVWPSSINIYRPIVQDGAISNEADAAYISTMHPEVGKALAASLRVLGSVDYPEVRMGVSVHTQKVFDAALALADILLAGAS
jgi:hypothetical protein